MQTSAIRVNDPDHVVAAGGLASLVARLALTLAEEEVVQAAAPDPIGAGLPDGLPVPLVRKAVEVGRRHAHPLNRLAHAESLNATLEEPVQEIVNVSSQTRVATGG
ncbi:hypothetical protein PG991_012158 [Apiospora marii]|uniref:Uncharacterized protein n=1 Tax=Apiospora marii TaxID=335849 RepID=A0ABR1R9U1_9PEZI